MPGKPLFFATAMPMNGTRSSACSSKATRAARRKSKATRIIRPAAAPQTFSRRRRSLVSTIRIARARVDRSWRHSPLRRLCRAMRGPLDGAEGQAGSGIRILTETVASPTLAAQMKDLLARYPAGEMDPVGTARPPQRARRKPSRVWRLRRSAVRHRRKPTSCLSLDADFLARARPGFAALARVRRRAAGLKAIRPSSIVSTPSRATPPTPDRAPTIVCR